MKRHYSNDSIRIDLNALGNDHYKDSLLPEYKDYFDWEDTDPALLVKAALLEWRGDVVWECVRDLAIKRGLIKA